jgi:hypothetical protein
MDMGSTSGDDNEGAGFQRGYLDCRRPWTTRLCLLYRCLHAYDSVLCVCVGDGQKDHIL